MLPDIRNGKGDGHGAPILNRHCKSPFADLLGSKRVSRPLRQSDIFVDDGAEEVFRHFLQLIQTLCLGPTL
jgi:hypothetical protein